MYYWLGEKLKKNSNLPQFSEEASSSQKSNAEDNYLGENSNLNSDLISLTIISPKGSLWKAKFSPEMKIAKLKEVSLNYFSNSTEINYSDHMHHLINISECRTLVESKTIKEERIHQNDEVLLFYQNKFCLKTQKEYHCITLDEIREATAAKVPKNLFAQVPLLHCTESYNAEIRKIMVSLVHATAKILENDKEIINYVKPLKKRLEAEKKIEPRINDVNHLVEMGFSSSQAKRALNLKRNNQAQALDWLLECESIDLEDEIENLDEKSSSSLGQKEDFISDIHFILHLLKLKRRKEFIPKKNFFQTLLNIGFDPQISREALFLAGNNIHGACEWLLGEKSREEIDVDEPIALDSTICKTLMENPLIMSNLYRSRTLMALLSILENKEITTSWMSDVEMQNFFTEIFKIHHIERHSVT